MQIRPATDADKLQIEALYKDQIGKPFCAWDDHYPTMQEIKFDLSRDALFVMVDEQNNIIASISIDEDEAVSGLPCWSKELMPGAELSRLAVAEPYQNQGIARQMLLYGMQKLRERGCKSVHFLVNQYNEKALRSYAHLHFEQVGETRLFEQPFYCFEKEL